MAEVTISLSWDAHQKNMCSGLSLLQQRGEFVDMTLAADGHLVKVHQMVLALVSPYIKDLIASAPCPHPVIFLNNISYTTLCEILEYIYTGEVLVPKESLSDLIAAGSALHIKGLEDMCDEDHLGLEEEVLECMDESNNSSRVDQLKDKNKHIKEDQQTSICKIFMDEPEKDTDVAMDEMDNSTDNFTHEDVPKKQEEEIIKSLNSFNVQFGVSSHGGLQIIYNRFIYHLRYLHKNGNRSWRCIDYSPTMKCPAKLITNDNHEVLKRIFNHIHPFHDGKILRKARSGMLYSEIQEAEDQAQNRKEERKLRSSTPPQNESDGIDQ